LKSVLYEYEKIKLLNKRQFMKNTRDSAACPKNAVNFLPA